MSGQKDMGGRYEAHVGNDAPPLMAAEKRETSGREFFSLLQEAAKTNDLRSQ